MTIFVLIALNQAPSVQAAVQRVYPDDFLKVSEDVWLISAKGTSKDISDALNITEGLGGTSGMVFASAGYFGRAAPSYSEWVANKLGPVVI